MFNREKEREALREEIMADIQREKEQEEQKEVQRKKKVSYEVRFKKGTTFKYLQIKAMLRGFDLHQLPGGHYSVVPDVVHVVKGVTYSLTIDLDLLECLLEQQKGTTYETK